MSALGHMLLGLLALAAPAFAQEDEREFVRLEFEVTALAGAHEEAECLRCHNDRGPVALFQTRMNSEHQGESGYSWTSSACYRCHPNGNG